jgi:hypothetical protein
MQTLVLQLDTCRCEKLGLGVGPSDKAGSERASQQLKQQQGRLQGSGEAPQQGSAGQGTPGDDDRVDSPVLKQRLQDQLKVCRSSM